MLGAIIAFSVRQKFLILLFVLAWIGYGLYELRRLPIDAVPDITNNQAQIITVASSYGATDIERLVTFPIEQACSNIAGVQELRSFSRFGLSLITIVFDEGVDIYWARQQIAERLLQVRGQIPPEIGSPELGPISTGLGEIYQYVVRVKKGYEGRYTLTDLRTIQDWIIRRQLLGVQGVAEVSSFGGALKQYEVAVRTERLNALNLTLDDVYAALRDGNQNTGGAYIEQGAQVLYIRTEGLIGDKEQIAQLPVAYTAAGIPILVGEIADVRISAATRYGALCYNDEGEVAGGIVMMIKGGNSNEVVHNVKERIAQIEKTLPEGILIEAFLDRTKMVNNAIGTVQTNLLEGALIVVLILVLFLGNFRAGLLVASVIPLSMLFAVIMMNMFGVSGNLMSLGALDFGLIVDGAVIIVEAVLHQLHLRKGRGLLNQTEMDGEVSTAANKMMSSAVFGQIIILVVYLPIFSLQGIEGKMFTPMAQTVAFALVGAFICSLTYVPMMSAWLLSKKVGEGDSWVDRTMNALSRAYQRLLARVLRRAALLLGAVGVMLVASVYLLLQLGGEFIPALEEGDFAVETRLLTGSNLSTSIEYTQKCAHLLKTRYPEVEKIVTKIGSAEIPTDPMPMDLADMMVILKPKSEWTSAKTFPELAEKMTATLEEVPNVSVGFQFPVQMRFNELVTGARQDVVCKIFGEDLDTLVHYAERLGHIVQSVEGSADLYVEAVSGMPQIVIRPNRAALMQYQLSISQVNDWLNIGLAGRSAGIVMEGEKRFELRLRLAGEARNSIEDIRNMLIPTPKGVAIPLHQLAEVELQNGYNQIQRENARRRISVGFNVRGRDVQSIVGELQQKVESKIKLPAGYTITYGGSFENLNQAKSRLMIAVPISLALIFLLLFFAFGSLGQSALIYTTIPLSAMGGIFFLVWRGMPFSISAGIGFIALFGVAVLNGIVLLAEFNYLQKSGMRNVYRIVLTGTATRLRPVLMTAFVASLGFLPMALSNGAGAEVQRPLATVVIGGLLIATLLTLFVLPLLYTLFMRGRLPRPSSASVAAGLLMLLLPLSLSAQTERIGLQAAIDSAWQNNRQHKEAQLLAEFAEKQRNAYRTLPATEFNTEFGQINSVYFDTRLSATQRFELPRVYKQQREVLASQALAAAAKVSESKAATAQTTSELFYTLLILEEQRRILMLSDSLYRGFYTQTLRRLENGESSMLEKNSAELQIGQIARQLTQVQAEIALYEIAFRLHCNTAKSYKPQADSLLLPLLAGSDSISAQHPILQSAAQEIRSTQARKKQEENRLLPSFSVGYANTSIRGTGADNQTYSGWHRFQTVGIGVALPLFRKAQKAEIAAAEIQIAIAENALLRESQRLQSQLQSAQTQYQLQSAQAQQFRQQILPAAQEMRRLAQQQFDLGSINYLEWTLLMQQSLQPQIDYLQILQSLNQQAAQINFLRYIEGK